MLPEPQAPLQTKQMKLGVDKEATWVQADKGYCSAKNGQRLCQIGLRSGIQRKPYRHKPLSVWEKRYHKLRGRSRYQMARVGGGVWNVGLVG